MKNTAIPPVLRSDEAERAILGTIMADNSVFDSVRNALSPGEFSSTFHRVIFRSMHRLAALASPIDLITVNDELGAEIADAGGTAYLASLADSLMRVSNVAHYVKIVKDKALAREMLSNQELIEQQLREGCEEPLAICARSVEALNSLAAQHGTSSLSWHNKFHRLDELPEGEIDFAIDNFLPRGVTFLGAFSGSGKTWLQLSMSRALTTGKPFLGVFPVNEKIPCLYLCPEMSAKGFRRRAERFALDKSLFFCQTIADGSAIDLGDSLLLAAVRDLRPVLFLDTAIRFNTAEDESSATQNSQGLGRAIFRLLYHGAQAVVGAHHRAKNAATAEEMTLENTLRGTGDLGALCDSVWGLQFEKSPEGQYNGNSVYAAQSRKLVRLSVHCVKARDFAAPEPFTVQLFPHLDNVHDFAMLTHATDETDSVRVQKAIEDDLQASLRELEERTGIGRNRVAKIAESLGWLKSKHGWERVLA
ncbi:MAG: DnaB-like helicase N-terminal domain-containing protein [Candidatus Acidiferrum sp.]